MYDRARDTLDGRVKSTLDAVGRGVSSSNAEELDIFRARIDELAQLVTDSATQHEQHAAALAQHATALQAQQQQLSTQVGILTEQYAHISADYKKLAALLAQV